MNSRAIKKNNGFADKEKKENSFSLFKYWIFKIINYS